MCASPASSPRPASDSPAWSGEKAPPLVVGAVERTLVVMPRRCIGCRTCELACSFAHGGPGRMARARIRVHPAGEKRFVQITCLQCENAACAKVCPVQAIARDERTRALVVSPERCVGCGLCEAACPFGHMHFDRETRRAEKCDLCGGNPACAAFCPAKALEYR